MGVRGLLQEFGWAMQRVVPGTAVPAGARVGIDGSAIIHSLLRRHMDDILRKESWTTFDASVGSVLTRIGAWKGGTVKLKVVLDGARLESKLVNVERAEVRRRAIATISEEGEAASRAQLSKAVGSKAVEAAAHVTAVCRALGVPCCTAPAEAEAHLRYLQVRGEIDVILANDSDYIVLRCKHVIFADAGNLWVRDCRYWQGPRAVDPGELDCLQHGGERRRDLATVLSKWGFDGVVLLACFAGNDYCNLAGVAMARARQALAHVASRGLVDPAAPMSDVVVAVATRLHVSVKPPVDSNWTTATDVAKKVEKALVMFTSPTVYDDDTKVLTSLSPMPLLRLHDDAAAHKLTSLYYLRDRISDLPAFHRGEVNVTTFQPQDVPVVEAAEPAGAPAPDAPELPSAQALGLMKKDQLVDFLKAQGLSHSGIKSVLLQRTIGWLTLHDTGLAQLSKASALPTTVALAEVGKEQAAAWNMIQGPGWVPVQETDGQVRTGGGRAGGGESDVYTIHVHRSSHACTPPGSAETPSCARKGGAAALSRGRKHAQRPSHGEDGAAVCG